MGWVDKEEEYAGKKSEGKNEHGAKDEGKVLAAKVMVGFMVGMVG